MEKRELESVKRSLKMGETYIFSLDELDELSGARIRKRRYRLLRKYKYIAEFEEVLTGIRRSFQYWELSGMLRGEVRK